MEDYTAPVGAALSAGFTIRFDLHGRAFFCVNGRLQNGGLRV